MRIATTIAASLALSLAISYSEEEYRAVPFSVQSCSISNETEFLSCSLRFSLNGRLLKYGVISGMNNEQGETWVGSADYDFIEVRREKNWLKAEDLSRDFCGTGKGMFHFVPETRQLLLVGLGDKESIRSEFRNFSIDEPLAWMRIGVEIDIVLSDMTASSEIIYSDPFLIDLREGFRLFTIEGDGYGYYFHDDETKMRILDEEIEQVRTTGSSEYTKEIEISNQSSHTTPASAPR